MHNESEALEYLAINEPDMLLMDFNKPVLIGFETVNVIRKEFLNLMVFMLSIPDDFILSKNLIELSVKT